MLYHWLGWVSLAICVLLLAKHIGRVSKNKKWNLPLRKIHKPLGLAVIGISVLHGILCTVKHPERIAVNLTGWMLFLMIAALAGTFYAKAKLHGKWFRLHRYLAALLCAFLAVHVTIALI